MWFLELAALVGTGIGAYLIWRAISSGGRKRKQTALKKQNVVAIIDARHGLWNKLENLEIKTSITQDTFIQLKDTLDTMGVCNIKLVMHTFGGSLSAAEAISRRILLAREKGCHIVCLVPYYAYSAGCMIAASCDEIHMSDSAFLGPADAQLGSLLSSNSINAICKTVEWQLENCKDKIKSDWYAKYTEALATRDRQRKWIDELVSRGFYTRQVADSIYEELFSGKYNHDQVIHPEWAKRIGLAVTVTEMPPYVKEMLVLHNAQVE